MEYENVDIRARGNTMEKIITWFTIINNKAYEKTLKIKEE